MASSEARKYLSRPARKQGSFKVYTVSCSSFCFHLADRFESEDTSHADYNIWYHRRSGHRHSKRTEPAASRCCVERDAGYTLGSKSGVWTHCLHFAHGKCAKGKDCHYLHFVPTEFSDSKLSTTADIFGRDRHR